MVAGLAGCATYETLPLPRSPNLAISLSGLKTTILDEETGSAIRKIDITRPLAIDDVGLLAILNDPDLKSEQWNS